MYNPKISIIVPVYNAEKYLNRCIDSILSQSLKDFEVLLIDDGSTDKSGTICDEYAKKDNRIRVFHKENGGVSSARNVGLDEAKGEYISFIDSDDWVVPIYLAELLSLYHGNIDLTECSYIYYGNEQILFKTEFVETDSESYLEKLFQNKRFYEGFLWVKLFKATLITNLRFDSKLAYNEDRVFIAQYVLKCRKVATTQNCLYYYDNTHANAMSKLGSVIDNKTITELDSYRFLLKLPDFSENIKKAISKYAQHILLNFYNIAKDDHQLELLEDYYIFFTKKEKPLWLLRLFRNYWYLGHIFYSIRRYKSNVKIKLILLIKKILRYDKV